MTKIADLPSAVHLFLVGIVDSPPKDHDCTMYSKRVHIRLNVKMGQTRIFAMGFCAFPANPRNLWIISFAIFSSLNMIPVPMDRHAAGPPPFTVSSCPWMEMKPGQTERSTMTGTMELYPPRYRFWPFALCGTEKFCGFVFATSKQMVNETENIILI